MRWRWTQSGSLWQSRRAAQLSPSLPSLGGQKVRKGGWNLSHFWSYRILTTLTQPLFSENIPPRPVSPHTAWRVDGEYATAHLAWRIFHPPVTSGSSYSFHFLLLPFITELGWSYPALNDSWTEKLMEYFTRCNRTGPLRRSWLLTGGTLIKEGLGRMIGRPQMWRDGVQWRQAPRWLSAFAYLQ